MANETKIREMMAYIKANPEEWNMAQFVCATQGCAAGVTVMLETKMTWPRLVNSDINIESYAQKLLGLTTAESDQMFYAIDYCEKHQSFLDTPPHDIQTPNGDWLDCPIRHPTYEEFEKEVTRITGIEFAEVNA